MPDLLYLSGEWLKECKRALDSSELVEEAGNGKFTASFQHHVTGLPDEYGDERMSFYSVFRQGKCEVVHFGVMESPDFTFTGDYSAWRAIHTGQKGIVASVLVRRLKMRANPFRAVCAGLRYRKMLRMNEVIASVPTRFFE